MKNKNKALEITSEIVNGRYCNKFEMNEDYEQIKKVFKSYCFVDLWGEMVNYDGEKYPFESVFFKFRPDMVQLLIEKKVIDFNKEYNINPEKTFLLIKKLISNNLINEDILTWVKEKYKITNDDKRLNGLLLSSINLETLKYFENIGFNIWRVIKKSNDVETLLPTIIHNKSKKITTEYNSAIDFFISRKEKWKNISTEITSNEDFTNRLIFSFLYLDDERFLNLINNLGYKKIEDLNLNIKECFNKKTYSGFEILIKRKKHNFIVKLLNKKIINNLTQEEYYKMWFALITSEPGYASCIFVNNKSRYLKRGEVIYQKMWNFLTNKINDFSEKINDKDIFTNIFNQSINKDLNAPLFIPLNLNKNKLVDVDSIYIKSTSRLNSLENLVYFLKEKNFDFFIINENNNRLVYSDILLYSLSQASYWFKNEGFTNLMGELLDKTTIENKERILSDFVKDLDTIINNNIENFYTKMTGLENYTDLFFDIIEMMKNKVIFENNFKNFEICFELINNPKIVKIKKDKIVLENILNDINTIAEYKELTFKLRKDNKKVSSKVNKI